MENTIKRPIFIKCANFYQQYNDHEVVGNTIITSNMWLDLVNCCKMISRFSDLEEDGSLFFIRYQSIELQYLFL